MIFLWLLMLSAIVVASFIVLNKLWSGSQDIKFANVIKHEEPRYNIEDPISWVSFYIASDQPWAGQEVVDALIAYDLQFDEEEKLFVYYSNNNILFRVAQATHPVSFDMNHLADTLIHGLAIFMDTTEVYDPKVAYNMMVKIAEQLTTRLNGLLVDQGKKPLSLDDINRIQNKLSHNATEVA